MLTHLSIQNYALIEKIEIDFPAGLTIITGETGAGKSILLGALSLIAGSRADSSVLQDKARKCIVEGVFNVAGYRLQSFFEENELDYSDQAMIRREVSPEGKSRAFINDTPVNLNVLKNLSVELIDIHSQHETLTLNEAGYQLSVVDAFAGVEEYGDRYKPEYRRLKDLERQLAELLEKEKQSKLDADYWQFQYEEFERLRLQAGEQEKAEEELKVLENADEIKSVLEAVSRSLDSGDQTILTHLAENKSRLAAVSRLNPAYGELLSRISSAYIELKDIAGEIEALTEKVASDPKRTEELTARLDEIYRLQKKHQVNSVEGLLEVQAKVEARLKENSSMEGELNRLRAETEKGREKLFSLAKKISSARVKSLPLLEKEISKLLSLLAMPDAQFRAGHTLLETLTEQGIDKVKFLFSANKGSDLKEISKVASGGELSRLMLSIKSLIAKKTALPTIIFDEIDTGVSGGVAEQVGKLILGMSEASSRNQAGMQVIAITHLPQIASKGASHLTVYKEVKSGKTFTQIKPLSKEERIKEIAKMLSAGQPTEASVKNAKELLGM